MKKHSSLVVTCLALLLLLTLLVQVTSLRSQVESLSHRQDDLSNRVMEMTVNLRNQVEAGFQSKASVVHRFEVRYGDMDVQTLTVPAHITAQPKEMAADTTLTLILDEIKHPFTRQGDDFLLDLSLSVPMSTDKAMTLCVESGGVKELEVMQNMLDPNSLLPRPSAYFSGRVQVSGDKVHYQGDLELRLATVSEELTFDVLQSFRLLVTENDRVVFEKTYPRDAISRINPQDEIMHRMKMDETVPLREGVAQDLWLQVTDQYGLIHQILLKRITTNVSTDGSVLVPESQGGETYLFRADGTLLNASNFTQIPPLYQGLS